MLATIVLATFLCTVDSNKAESCETTYLQSWQDVSDYHKDSDNCKEVLNVLFPNSDPITDPNDANKFTFASCYRVLPGEWLNLKPKAIYLQNIQDADDSFTDYRSKLEIQ